MAQRNTFRDDEDLEEKINMRDLARVGVYLKPYMARVVWILIVVAAMGCINVVEPYLTKIMIDSVIPAKNLALLGELVALLAVLGVCTYGFILKGSDTIFPNVYVAGVNVGGLKRDAAINAVKLAVEQETAADTLTVVLPDRTIEFTPEVTNVALNPDEAADAAINYGRDGGPIKALITYQKAKKDRQDIALESGKNLDTTYIRDLIDQTARACASEKIDPIVTVDADAKTVTVVTGSPKISLDADKLYDEVVARFESGDFSDLKFDYDTEPCAPVDLQTYYDQFATEMKDAYYDEEKKELVAEKVGFGFDVSYYTQQIAMADAGTTILMVTHDCNAASYCKRILFIQDGVLFHELRRDVPDETQQAFYGRILAVMAQLGGGSANVL